MLDKKIFMVGITKLTKKYVNFKFNLTDQDQLECWYEDFSFLTDDEFKELITTYSKKNEFAPQSPASILKVLEDVKNNSSSGEEFANYLLDLNRKLGFNYNSNTCYEEIENIYGLVGVDVAKQFADRLKKITNAEIGTITAQIREAYKVASKRDSYKKELPNLVKLANNNIEHTKEFLTDEQIKMLEEN